MARAVLLRGVNVGGHRSFRPSAFAAKLRHLDVGIYRRQMAAIRHLGTLDRVFGVPVTTRNGNTVGAFAEVLARAS